MSQQIIIIGIVVAILPFIIALMIWLFRNHGIDRIKNPKEWQTAGSSGERILYNTLRKELKIPESQILRNVYIPAKTGKTSEIDILVVSKKGIFVFECKNYGGRIYGDASLSKWIQYIGKKKNYFYNPLSQNKKHAKCLKEFLGKECEEIPVVPLVSVISRGNWKVKNLTPTDYFLGLNCHFEDIYNNLPDSQLMAKHFKKILEKLTPLSRPSEEVKKTHIEQTNALKHKSQT
ncbi:NERD domain-containing protein [Candidatus Saccharibacteria bacterium]|nr:NERD domain-containing protein [Candidatus Saccharibacteria bacterium]